MKLAKEATTPALNRLKRARGQLDAVIRAIEEGGECEDIVTQLAACSRAMERAGFLLVAAGLRQCITEENDVDTEKLEKLFLSFA